MTAMEFEKSMGRGDKIFNSVFQSPSAALAKSFHESDNTASRDAFVAWSLVTSWLQLPRNTDERVRYHEPPPECEEAFSYLLSDDETSGRLVRTQPPHCQTITNGSPRSIGYQTRFSTVRTFP